MQVSRDGGRTWTNVTARIPGLPEASYVAGIEASRRADGTVYVAFDNHRSDDFGNYLYRSDDHGRSWRSITGDLPARRVIRAVHEDPRNPRLLYIGTEFGFYFSIDGGGRWIELKNDMPTVAVNDFAVHPRDNDLVLGTHGRGIWILDNINAIQELTPEVVASEAHLFTVEPAEQIRYAREKAHAGDMVFRGENPPAGATIDYWLREARSDVTLAVHDASGTRVRTLEPDTAAGIRRVVWDLRHAPPVAPDPERPRSGPAGPFVVPGTYTVRLVVGGRSHQRRIEVREDPRLRVDPAERRAWTATLLELGALYRATSERLDAVREVQKRLADLGAEAKANAAEVDELVRALGELRSRIGSVYGAIEGWTGPPTQDQRAQIEYFTELSARLAARASAVTAATGR